MPKPPLVYPLLCWSAVFVTGGSLWAAEPAALDTVEKSAADWLKVRAETSRLETDWSTQRPLLESMARGLAERAQSLESRRDLLMAKTAKDREEQAQAEAANALVTETLKNTEAQLQVLTKSLLELRRRLPPRLSSALEVSFKSLKAPELTVGERMHLAVTVLNRCLQFNRGVTVEDEILTFDGTSGAKEAEVVYWGLSNAYALDRPAGKVWLGVPATEGWRWEPMSDGVEKVEKLIAIYRGKAEPEFVQIPARIQDPIANPGAQK